MIHILVVDDDAIVSGAIRATLENKGYLVTTADNSAAGLKALDELAFDLMIVDIFMPHMRGFESVRVFHQHAMKVPLIAISGYMFAEHRTPAPDFLSMAVGLGATRCLRKPFTGGTLLAAVEICFAEVAAASERLLRQIN